MTATINLAKQNLYALRRSQGAKVAKQNLYALRKVGYGSLYQDVNANRPIYREAPSGGVPYIDMSATSAALKLNVLDAGTYTLIIYKSDQTFSVSEIELTAGENTLPITEDFNQLCCLLKARMHPYAIEAIKEGMKARAA